MEAGCTFCHPTNGVTALKRTGEPLANQRDPEMMAVKAIGCSCV